MAELLCQSKSGDFLIGECGSQDWMSHAHPSQLDHDAKAVN